MDRPVENHPRDAFATPSDPPIDPSLEHMFTHPTSAIQNDPTLQSRDQDRSLYIPGFEGIPEQHVPHVQLAPVAPRPHHYHKKVLADVPRHEYIISGGGAINATLTDIIAILPHWFRNRELSMRFLNNGINAGIHVVLLEEHRHVDVYTLEDRKRWRDRLGDAYRRSMRKVDPEWKQGKHRAPQGWNEQDIDIAGFVPETAREAGYTAPPAIPFKDLSIGLKKLPQGNDAGDLTRALDYAMHNRKVDEQGQEAEFMFPDDLHAILNQIGRAQVTRQHTDRSVLARHTKVQRDTSHVKSKQTTDRKQRELTSTQTPGESPHAQLAFMSPTPRQSTYEDFCANLHAYHPQQPAPKFHSPDDGRYEMDMKSATPTPVDQLPLQMSLDDVFQDQGYGSTVLNGSSDGFAFPSSSPLQRSNSQEAAAAVASQLVAQRANQAVTDLSDSNFSGIDYSDIDWSTTDLPDIPAIRALDAVPNQTIHVPDWLNLSPEAAEREMDNLMTSVYTPYDESGLPMQDTSFDFIALETPFDFTGLPTPNPSSPLPAQLLQNCPEDLDEEDQTDFARASRWARQYPGMRFTVGDARMVVEMLEMTGGGNAVADEAGEKARQGEQDEE
jgi:hypothetical protein